MLSVKTLGRRSCPRWFTYSLEWGIEVLTRKAGFNPNPRLLIFAPLSQCLNKSSLALVFLNVCLYIGHWTVEMLTRFFIKVKVFVGSFQG